MRGSAGALPDARRAECLLLQSPMLGNRYDGGMTPTHRRSCLVLVLGLLACGPQVEAPPEDPSGSTSETPTSATESGDGVADGGTSVGSSGGEDSSTGPDSASPWTTPDRVLNIVHCAELGGDPSLYVEAVSAQYDADPGCLPLDALPEEPWHMLLFEFEPWDGMGGTFTLNDGVARAWVEGLGEPFLDGVVTLEVSEPWVAVALTFETDDVQGTLDLTACVDGEAKTCE